MVTSPLTRPDRLIRTHIPHARGEEAEGDETHLQNGLVGPWVARSSSILRGPQLSCWPHLIAKCGSQAFIVAWSGTSPVER